MPAQKILVIDATTNFPKEVAVNTTSAGVADEGKVVGLNAQGKIDGSMLPNVDSRTVVASENLNVGDIVNIWNDGGTPKVRKASAVDALKLPDGFVLNSCSSGQSITVHQEGTISGLVGLTIGSTYYLSNTPGAVVLAASAAPNAGNIVAIIGRASSTTEISFEPNVIAIRG